MSIVMDEEIKRSTARRKTVLVLEIIQGKTSVTDASRQFDLPPRKSRAGLRRASEGWRTHCAPNRKMCVSSTSGN
nr:hypothetical protein [Dyella telluris]